MNTFVILNVHYRFHQAKVILASIILFVKKETLRGTTLLIPHPILSLFAASLFIISGYNKNRYNYSNELSSQGEIDEQP